MTEARERISLRYAMDGRCLRVAHIVAVFVCSRKAIPAGDSMTDSIEQMYRRSGWSKAGASRARQKHEQQSAPSRLLKLPDRKSTLELGAELLVARRGGRTEQISADELIIEQMVMRALGKKKRLRDYLDLYALANAEDEAELARPLEISPYRRKKILDCLKNFVRTYDRVRTNLIASGLAEVGEDGVLRPVRRVGETSPS